MKGFVKLEEYLNLPRSDGMTPLTIAIKENSLVMVAVILEAGADMNRLYNKKETPVTYAIKQNNPDIVNYMISLAQIDLSFNNKPSRSRFNPLYHFIEIGDFHRVKLIIETVKTKHPN